MHRKFRLLSPGKASSHSTELPRFFFLFSVWCFCNPPNFDMDYRILNVHTFLCMRIHTGVGHIRQRASTTFWLGKTFTNFSCALDGIRTSGHGIHWILRPREETQKSGIKLTALRLQTGGKTSEWGRSEIRNVPVKGVPHEGSWDGDFSLCDDLEDSADQLVLGTGHFWLELVIVLLAEVVPVTQTHCSQHSSQKHCGIWTSHRTKIREQFPPLQTTIQTRKNITLHAADPSKTISFGLLQIIGACCCNRATIGTRSTETFNKVCFSTSSPPTTDSRGVNDLINWLL